MVRLSLNLSGLIHQLNSQVDWTVILLIYQDSLNFCIETVHYYPSTKINFYPLIKITNLKKYCKFYTQIATNKFDELLTIVDNIKPDLILLTEVIPKAQTLPIGIPRPSIRGFQLFINFDPNLYNLGKSGYRGLAVS